ncbi:hypothetical protein LINPERPRIM_LOCUS1537 [Linum perenne]|jgi:hypothetical protein
MLILA